ncbi:MAG: glycoside hydrolase family 16 protein [Actinoplanes sp.]
MHSVRTLLIAATAAMTLTGCLSSFPPDESGASVSQKYSFSDDFDGPAGSAIDAGKWQFDVGNRWGDNELEYYAHSTDNVALDGQGNLAITARKGNPAGYQCQYGTCEYTSGRVLTEGKFSQKYGRFEARIKIPTGQGIWPAFWLLGGNKWPDQGEIDILENLGHTPDVLHATIHGPGYSGAAGITKKQKTGRNLSDDFHTYALDWSPSRLVWYLDGEEYFRITKAQLKGKDWVFDHPFFIILNVAVGGAWPGRPDESTVFPQTMLVDWVRVTEH